MACCSREWCDFVVMSGGEIFVERIKFDKVFWEGCEAKLKSFYYNYYLKELVYPTVQ